MVKVKESASVNNLPLADLRANNLAHLHYTEEPSQVCSYIILRSCITSIYIPEFQQLIASPSLQR